MWIHLAISCAGATKVSLVRPDPKGRDRGIVTSVKDNFGFIKPEVVLPICLHVSRLEWSSDCCSFAVKWQGAGDRDPDVFFHFSELTKPARHSFAVVSLCPSR